MPINEAARHFAKAMIDAGREPSFIFEVMFAYFGNAGREAALAVMEEYEGNTDDAEGVEPSPQTP